MSLSSLIMLITSISSLALCAVAVWRTGSRASRRTRSQPSEPQAPSSLDSRLAQLEADQAALYSTLEKLTTTVKRLSSRSGMRELRENRQSELTTPPPGTAKADLLRHYGMAGKVGPDFHRAQQELEAKLRVQNGKGGEE